MKGVGSRVHARTGQGAAGPYQSAVPAWILLIFYLFGSDVSLNDSVTL